MQPTPSVIEVFPTSIIIESDTFGYATNGVNIKSVCAKFIDFEYVQIENKFKPKQIFMLYDAPNNRRILPRQALGHIVDLYEKENAKYILDYAELPKPKQIDVALNPGWEIRDYQQEMLDFLAVPSSMKGIEMQTGKGKTFTSFADICRHKELSCVIVSGLVEQWYSSALECTTLKEEDICIIKGFTSIQKIVNRKDTEPEPKLYIISLDTLRQWISSTSELYGLLPSWVEFTTSRRITKKYMDECHQQMMSVITVDLLSAVNENIYLSATPSRSVRSEKKIFQNVWPPEIFYGAGVYDKYANIYMYNFDYRVPGSCRSHKGYSHLKYESKLLNDNLRFDYYVCDILFKIITKHFSNIRDADEKLLILVSTASMAENLQIKLAKIFSDMDVRTFLHKDSDDVLTDADIIVSTHKSAGTGRDIKKLRTCINTVSFKSEILCKQQLGRLRKLKENTPEMIDMINVAIPDQIRHGNERKLIYKDLALKFFECCL